MGVKNRKQIRKRTEYTLDQHDQYAVDPSEIDDDAPTHCALCGDELTPLRRLAKIPYCAHKEDCQLAQRLDWVKDKVLINLPKQQDELVIRQSGDVITAHRRGPL